MIIQRCERCDRTLPYPGVGLPTLCPACRRTLDDEIEAELHERADIERQLTAARLALLALAGLVAWLALTGAVAFLLGW